MIRKRNQFRAHSWLLLTMTCFLFSNEKIPDSTHVPEASASQILLQLLSSSLAHILPIVYVICPSRYTMLKGTKKFKQTEMTRRDIYAGEVGRAYIRWKVLLI